MKYKNAADILPDELLKALQQYSAGETLYIPKVEKRKKWGEGSGARTFYTERNKQIRACYTQGATCKELAESFCLSLESIKKIIHSG